MKAKIIKSKRVVKVEHVDTKFIIELHMDEARALYWLLGTLDQKHMEECWDRWKREGKLNTDDNIDNLYNLSDELMDEMDLQDIWRY